MDNIWTGTYICSLFWNPIFEKKDDIQNAKYIVRRKKGVCILGGVAYGATVSFFLLTLIFAEFSYIEFIIMSCCTSCMLFISFLLFCMYREQKIIVKEKEIIICNFLGKKKVIDRQEVDKIVTDQNQIRYSFLNKQNEQLFYMSINMVDAVRFIQDTLAELEKKSE